MTFCDADLELLYGQMTNEQLEVAEDDAIRSHDEDTVSILTIEYQRRIKLGLYTQEKNIGIHRLERK